MAKTPADRNADWQSTCISRECVRQTDWRPKIVLSHRIDCVCLRLLFFPLLLVNDGFPTNKFNSFVGIYDWTHAVRVLLHVSIRYPQVRGINLTRKRMPLSCGDSPEKLKTQQTVKRTAPKIDSFSRRHTCSVFATGPVPGTADDSICAP